MGAIPSVPRSVADPIASNAANVTGTLNVLMVARDESAKRVAYSSLSSVYGNSPKLPKREDMPTNPLSPYAVSKLAGENYCIAFHQVYGLPMELECRSCMCEMISTRCSAVYEMIYPTLIVCQRLISQSQCITSFQTKTSSTSSPVSSRDG